VSDEPAPDPAPPEGAPFLAQRIGDEVCVRAWASSADAVSPVVVVRLERDGAHAYRVVGRFREGSTSRLGKRVRAAHYVVPILVLAAAVGVAALFVGASALYLPLLAVLLAVPAGIVMVPLLMLWNAHSRRQHMESLWELMGEVFVPVALPASPEEDPFRQAARRERAPADSLE
jgi:hypothetical protein